MPVKVNTFKINIVSMLIRLEADKKLRLGVIIALDVIQETVKYLDDKC